jgi:integrase
LHTEFCEWDEVKKRSLVLQQKTKRPVRFEISKHTREAILNWLKTAGLSTGDYIFPSNRTGIHHMSARQYARTVKNWVSMIGLDPEAYGTPSLRRTKAALICKQTKNLRAVQLLLGHTRLESTFRYLGIDVDDALEVAEQIEI